MMNVLVVKKLMTLVEGKEKHLIDKGKLEKFEMRGRESHGTACNVDCLLHHLTNKTF
jgi:hypothetical protein